MPEDTSNAVLRSAIYKGWVWHHRFLPRQHKFNYRVFMLYLDLSELTTVLGKSRLWGQSWYHIGRFKRSDFFSLECNYKQDIDCAVRQEVGQQLGVKLSGPVCLLTNLRYFGYITNPISCYYCFNAEATKLTALLIEVTNTPWGEKHHYVLDLRHKLENDVIEFEKQLHVSPFMPMDRFYQWRGALPSQTLRYSLASVIKDNLDDATCATQFDSGVVFERQVMTGRNMNATLLLYPFMTAKVLSAIYWQALRLWMKRIPFVAHPDRTAA